MNIGFACLAVGVLNTDLKSCRLKNANEIKLSQLISYNLNSLENIIDYNKKNNILLFRISSDLIPFGSSPANTLPWFDIYNSSFLRIGEKIKNSNMRVSMHPGQYTVLNSTNEEVVSRAIEDLSYHAKVLDCLGIGTEHKIVLHIGGIYNDKNESINRFIRNYQKLDESVKKRLVVENDDKSYNISDVLSIGKALNIPVIFDNLHNKINQNDDEKDDFYWINECRKTWNEKDGKQKIHYSQQNPTKKTGSHSETICINEFMNFYNNLKRNDIDIMLEVKDKNLSAIKCINCTSKNKSIKELELEWSRYKYSVLESSPTNYLKIRKLLRNKNEYPAAFFYTLIEEAMKEKVEIGNSINAAQHIWGYFKDIATKKEKIMFLKTIEEYKAGKIFIKTMKNGLWKMAVKYDQLYLINSYYFLL